MESPLNTGWFNRPAIVDVRKRFGDWEGDTVIGKGHRGSLGSLVERKLLYTVIQAVPRKTAEAVHHAVTQGIAPQKDRVYTLTYAMVARLPTMKAWLPTLMPVSTSHILMPPWSGG